MLVSRGSVQIQRSPADVFDYLADMRNESRWMPGASGVTKTSDGEIGPGTTFDGSYARAGMVECRITTYDRPRSLTIHGDGKGLSFDDAIQLTDNAGGTELTAVMRTSPKGLFKLVAPMMRRVIDRQFQGNWDRLKAVLEETPG